MKNYRHIFFDLDHTLWDFDRSSDETLNELYIKYRLADFAPFTADDFTTEFKKVNYELWKLLDQGKIQKEQIRNNRFPAIFERLGFAAPPEALCEAISVDYIETCPQKPYLINHAADVLEYLLPKSEMHLITNGFADVQAVKIKSSGLARYFKHITTSECTGFMKPSPEIFAHALQKAGASIHESLMIGDSLDSDIKGAMAFGLDAVFFNRREPRGFAATHEIDCLSGLKNIL